MRAFAMRYPITLALLAIPVFAGEPGAGGSSSDEPKRSSPTARSQSADTGKWQLSVETPRKDGSKSITATLPANAPIPSGFGEVTPQFILRYRAGRVAAYVVFDTFLGRTNTIDVSVTVGQQPAEAQTWSISTDSRAAFVPGDALAFMERLKQADSFSIRVAPRKDRPVTASFSTTGIDVVIKALLSAGVKYGS